VCPTNEAVYEENVQFVEYVRKQRNIMYANRETVGMIFNRTVQIPTCNLFGPSSPPVKPESSPRAGVPNPVPPMTQVT